MAGAIPAWALLAHDSWKKSAVGILAGFRWITSSDNDRGARYRYIFYLLRVGPLLLTSVPDEGLLGRLFPLIMPVYQTSMSMGKLCNVSSLLSSTSARFLVS